MAPRRVLSAFAFTGRAALVTGCGGESGIGFAFARLLARLGARNAISSANERIPTARGSST